MKNKTVLSRALVSAGVAATLLTYAPVYADELADVRGLAKAGKIVEALNKTNAYLSKHPAEPQMRFMKGVLLTEQNKSDEAITVFSKLTEEYKDLPEPYNNLAVLYAAKGQYEQARAALEKAIRTNPSYMTAYENLGDIYGKMASQAYDKALALGSSNASLKSKLTLLRTLSNGTAPQMAAPASQVAQATQPRVAANMAPPLISPLPLPPGKSAPPQRIPALAATPPAPAPVPATKIAAAPVPAPKVAAAPVSTPLPASAKPAAVLPAPSVAKVEPAKPAPAPALSKTAPTATLAAAAPPAKPTPAPAPVVARAEPVKPPKSEPPKPAAAKPDTSDQDAALAQVHGWAKAWTAQNVDAYLGYYSREFEPPKGMSRKAWADERRARIEGKGRIRVAVDGPEVVVSGATAKVTFRQTYESDRLTTRSRKTLVLIKNGGKWQIKHESSGR